MSKLCSTLSINHNLYNQFPYIFKGILYSKKSSMISVDLSPWKVKSEFPTTVSLFSPFSLPEN